MSFELRHLETFVKVSEKGSFSQAAKALFRTQPTLSHTIKELEESLGVKLFDRGGKRVSLTRAGKTFLPLARRLLRMRDDALLAMQAFTGQPRGELPVGASTIPGEYILPPLLRKFVGKYPEIRPRVAIGDTRQVEELVTNGEVEIGLTGAPPKGGRLEAAPCFTDRLVAVYRRGHRWWGKREIPFDEFLKEPLLLREPGSGTRITLEAALKEKGVGMKDLAVIGEIGSTEGVKQGVIAGLGIAVVSDRAVTTEVAEGILGAAPVERLGLARSFYLLFLPREILSPLALRLVDFLLEEGRTQVTREPLGTAPPA